MSSIDKEQLDVVWPDVQWVCRRLKEFRESRGVTAESLASMLGVTRPRITDTEAARYNVKFSTIARISRALGVSYSELFSGAPQIGKLPKAKGVVKKKDDHKGSSTKIATPKRKL